MLKINRVLTLIKNFFYSYVIFIGIIIGWSIANAENSKHSFYVQQEYGHPVLDEGLIIYNENLKVRVNGQKQRFGFMPCDFIVSDKEDMFYAFGAAGICDPNPCYLDYDQRIGTKPERKEPQLMVDDENKKVIRLTEYEKERDVLITTYLTVNKGEKTLYYNFIVDTRSRVIRNVKFRILLRSQFNFNKYFAGKPFQQIDFGNSIGFVKWATAWSDVRNEGIMAVVSDSGEINFKTGYLWEMECVFRLGHMLNGQQKTFSLAIKYIDENPEKESKTFISNIAKNNIWKTLVENGARYHKMKNGNPINKVWVEDEGIRPVRPIENPKSIEWSKKRGEEVKVFRFTHFGISIRPEERIDTALNAGCNVISIGEYRTNKSKFPELNKRIHARGAMSWVELELYDDIWQAAKELLDPSLGDAAADGVGWDFELDPSPYYCDWVYDANGVLMTDDVISKYKKETGKDMIISTTREIMDWYGSLYARWYETYYKFIKSINPKAYFYVTANWYEPSFARELVRRCPGIIILCYEYYPYNNPFKRETSNVIGHNVLAWKNAGAIALFLSDMTNDELWHPYSIKMAMEAGADGAGSWYWMEDSKHLAEFTDVINKYFPGGLDRPDPVGQSGPEFYSDCGILHNWAGRSKYALSREKTTNE